MREIEEEGREQERESGCVTTDGSEKGHFHCMTFDCHGKSIQFLKESSCIFTLPFRKLFL